MKTFEQMVLESYHIEHLLFIERKMKAYLQYYGIKPDDNMNPNRFLRFGNCLFSLFDVQEEIKRRG